MVMWMHWLRWLLPQMQFGVHAGDGSVGCGACEMLWWSSALAKLTCITVTAGPRLLQRFVLLPRLGDTLLISSGYTMLNNHQLGLAAELAVLAGCCTYQPSSDKRGHTSLLLISGAPWPAGLRRHVVVLSVQHLPHKQLLQQDSRPHQPARGQ